MGEDDRENTQDFNPTIQLEHNTMASRGARQFMRNWYAVEVSWLLIPTLGIISDVFLQAIPLYARLDF